MMPAPVWWLAGAALGLLPILAIGQSPTADRVVSVAYARLIENPAAYAGRKLSVPACAATAAHHGAYLYDCRDPDAQILTLGGSPAAEMDLFGERSVVESRRVSAKMVGVLEWRPDALPACCLDPRFLFHLESVSEVRALPDGL